MADTFSKSQRARIMAAVKSKDTTPAPGKMVVRKLVHAMGYRYRLHQRRLPGTPDLVFARRGKIINVSGCFWHLHRCPRCRIPADHRDYWLKKLEGNAARDRRVQRELRSLGWKLLVVWECQTRPQKQAWLRRRLADFLEK